MISLWRQKQISYYLFCHRKLYDFLNKTISPGLYCINSTSLWIISFDDLEKEGYGEYKEYPLKDSYYRELKEVN